MLLYSPVISSRLNYIVEFIGDLMGIPINATNEKEKFCSTDSPKINYSDRKLSEAELHIVPHGLLFEPGIAKPEIDITSWEGEKIFFQSNGDIPFDILAASFYLLSRYEEYLPHEKDMYGRFAHQQSLAFKEGFLEQPLINQWVYILQKQLRRKFPSVTFPTKDFCFLPTYDIDEAWSYKYKSKGRLIGASIKNIFKGAFSTLAERRKVRAGLMPDPFDSYKWLDDQHQLYHLSPVYFFLLAAKTGRYDRNTLPEVKALQDLVKSHGKKYPIGIHPSWQSGNDNNLLKKEIESLELIVGRKISKSRQHFIRMNLPLTYRKLMAAGISEDYSMGYGSINGFRASVTSSFKWYDLEKDEVTNLVVHPFCFMYANAYFEQKSTPHEALNEMLKYYRVIYSVHGQMITIWHNTFLGTSKLFAGWRQVYQQFIAEIN